MSNCLEIQRDNDLLKNKLNYSEQQNKLLQKQQFNMDKINNLLDQSTQSILCGPTCQKEKTTNNLKQKYLDAQTNLQTAPIQLENAKKIYYEYSYGDPYYENILEDDLQKKAETIASLLSENFNDEISTSLTMNSYYSSELMSYDKIVELYEKYIEENEKLVLLLRESQGDILTNDRKTYYETDALNNLTFWYRLFWYIYYVLVIMLILAFIFSPIKLLKIQKIIISVLVIFYPYYIDSIVRWVYGLWKFIASRLPKNVYNNL